MRKMETLERRMCKFGSDKSANMEEVFQPELLLPGEKELVLITHDESTFYCNEGKRMFWMESKKKKILPKSKGQSLMISGFVCQCHGFMKSGTKKSYKVFLAGTNREGKMNFI
jgi:hypothetical protein